MKRGVARKANLHECWRWSRQPRRASTSKTTRMPRTKNVDDIAAVVGRSATRPDVPLVRASMVSPAAFSTFSSPCFYSLDVRFHVGVRGQRHAPAIGPDDVLAGRERAEAVRPAVGRLRVLLSRSLRSVRCVRSNAAQSRSCMYRMPAPATRSASNMTNCSTAVPKECSSDRSRARNRHTCMDVAAPAAAETARRIICTWMAVRLSTKRPDQNKYVGAAPALLAAWD